MILKHSRTSLRGHSLSLLPVAVPNVIVGAAAIILPSILFKTGSHPPFAFAETVLKVRNKSLKAKKAVVVTDAEMPEAPVLTTHVPGVARTWFDGKGIFSSCGKMTRVFGVTICASTAAWEESQTKCHHIANIMLQLLDNDADGRVDDIEVVKHMVANNFHMQVPKDDADYETSEWPEDGPGQMTSTWEAFPGSCDTPSNRGASNTDRSTWVRALENTPGSTSCDPRRDATTEECLHLITFAAQELWPDKWGATDTSEAGRALFAMNGNCGWGYSGNWRNPEGNSPECSGSYAYNDPTCEMACIVVEGIYWASVTWMGGLMTNERAESVAMEWLATVPDASMVAAVPSNQKNAKTLQEASPAMYALISDTTSKGHRWLPSIMPDGRYSVIATRNPTDGEPCSIWENPGKCSKVDGHQIWCNFDVDNSGYGHYEFCPSSCENIGFRDGIQYAVTISGMVTCQECCEGGPPMGCTNDGGTLTWVNWNPYGDEHTEHCPSAACTDDGIYEDGNRLAGLLECEACCENFNGPSGMSRYVRYELRTDLRGPHCPTGLDVPESECLEAAQTVGSHLNLSDRMSVSAWNYTPCGCFLWEYGTTAKINYDNGAGSCQSSMYTIGMICKVSQ